MFVLSTAKLVSELIFTSSAGLCERVLNLLTGEDDLQEMLTTTIHLLCMSACFFTLRFMYLAYKTSHSVVRILPKQRKDSSMSTMIVIGSGGHTTEMLRLVKVMTPGLYCPRIYVMASSDSTSEFKVHVLEEHLAAKSNRKYRKYSIFKIPRSRHVGQSFFTSAFSTVYSFLRCVPMMLYYRPGLVLCNGPGTCVPICILAFLLRTFFLSNTMIVFIESVCRVESLSMTGKILYYFADVLLVQWPDLEQKYGRVAYIGRIWYAQIICHHLSYSQGDITRLFQGVPSRSPSWSGTFTVLIFVSSKI